MKAEQTEHFETPNALRHDAHTLVEDARALLDATENIADENVAKARKHLAEALKSAKRVYARLQGEVVPGAETANRAVHEHPYQTALLAFGVGALVGCLLSRRG